MSMYRIKSNLFLLLVLFSLFGSVCFCSATIAEENKALKYHAILQKRPDPGYLFDRFYNAWLDQSTVESLQAFLDEQIKKEDTTSNRLLLAFFYVKQNDDITAINEFSKALKSDPTSASIWFHKAQAEARTLDFEVAISDLKQARKQKPGAKLSVRVERHLGTMLLRNHQSKEAMAVWKALLDAHPDDEELCEDVIDLHLEEGLHEPAAALSEALIARTKDPYLAVTRRLRLGDIFHRANKRQKAIDTYVSTLDKTGHDSWLEREILAQIEQIFRREDDLKGLKEQYAKLLAKYPKRIGLQRRRCRLLVQLGENDEAIKSYRKILELTPGDRGNREEYVDILSHLAKHDMAVKELELLCKQHPEDAELQVKLAKTLNQAKQTAKAIEAIEQYLKISDQTEYAYLRSARLAEQFGGKKKAVSFYNKMAKKFADSFSAQNIYATFLYSSEKKQEAIKIWKKLAQETDVNLTLNIARSLCTFQESKVALELLIIREKDFAEEPLYLGQLVKVALMLKKYDQALPWAKRRVELSKNVTDLEMAVSQTMAACKQSKKLDETISELEADPNRSVPSTCLLAELLESQGESQEADDLLKKLAKTDELLAIGQQIRLHQMRREWAEAAAATNRLLELSGGRKSLHVRRLVKLYEKDFQIDKALKWIETWKRLSTGSTTPWLSESRLLQIQGKEEAAQESLRKAIQRFDKDEDLRARLAQLYMSIGKTHDAERMYWQLYEQKEDITGKLRWVVELARLAEQDGHVAKLVDNFKQRHRNNRRSIVPLLALAEIHRITDNYEGRRQALLDATKIKPDDLLLLTHIASVEEREGNWEEAIETLQRAAKLDKTNKTRRKIAQLHLKYGNMDKGYAMLRELLDEQSIDPRSLERMADSLCVIGEWEHAIDLLSKRVTDFPEDYRLRYLLAIAYEESDQSTEAIAQFTQLLDAQEEMKSVKKKATSNVNSYYEMYRSLLPPQAMDWFYIAQSHYSAYMHRRHQNRYVRSGMSQSNIAPPPSVDMARSYALIHLINLSQELDESQQTVLTSDLESRGIYRPDLLFEIGFNHNSFSRSKITEILEEHPENEILLALTVIWGVNSQNIDATHLARAFEKFQKKRPGLAIMAAVYAASIEPKHAPLLEKAIKMAAKIKRPNLQVMASLLRPLGAQPGSQGSNLTQDQRNKIVKLLLDWYPKISKSNNPYGSYFFMQIASSLSQDEDPAPYFTLLEEKITEWRKTGKQAGQSHYYTHPSQSNNSFLVPFEFPPKELTDFPQDIFIIATGGANNPYYGREMIQSTVWEAKKIEPLLKKIKNPTLRLLLAKRYELPKVVESTLKEMLAKKPPSFDAYLLAASKASTDSKFEESIKLLEKARHLPMKPQMRQRVDAALVAAVLAIKEAIKKGKEVDKDILKAGRDAALRLRRQRLDQQKRDQLLLAFEELGLKKEAEKLEKRMVASSGRSSMGRFLSAPVYVTSSSSQKSRVDKLIESGKRDEAARLLIREVKFLGQSVSSNHSNSSYQTRNFRDRIKKLGIADDMLRLAKPKKSDNRIRLQEYAFVCEMLEKKNEARKTYKKILADRPKDDANRLRLIMVLGNEETVELEKHLDKLSDSSLNTLGQIISSSLHNHYMDWKEKFNLVKIAMVSLEEIEKRPRVDLHWAEQFIQSFGYSQYSNVTHKSLPSLYQRLPKSKHQRYASDNASDKSHKERAKLHHDFCLVMIDIPEIGRAGFTHLLATAEARRDKVWKTPAKKEVEVSEKAKTDEKETTPPKPSSKTTKSLFKETSDDYLRFAEKVLLAEADHRSKRSTNFSQTYYSSNSSSVRFRSPEEYLTVQAWKLKDWQKIDNVLLPHLAKSHKKHIHKLLSNLAKLYRCPSEEFLDVAKKVIKKPRIVSPRVSTVGNQLMLVVNIWSDRSMEVDLEPMVLDYLKKEARNNQNSTSRAAIEAYLTSLTKRGKKDKIQQVFEKLTTIYLGPAEKRVDFIKKHYQPDMWSPGTPNGRIHEYNSLLDHLAQSDSLMFIVLSQIEPFQHFLTRNNLSYRVNESIQRLLKKKPEEILAILETSFWFNDLESFRVFPLGQNVKKWPLVQFLQSSEIFDKKRKSFWKSLEEKQKKEPTFGKGLFLAVAAQKSKKTALLDFFEENIDDLKKLPEPEQIRISLLGREILHEEILKKKDELKDNTVRSWIDEHLASRSKQLLDKILKAKRLKDLGQNNNGIWSLGNYLGNLLPDVIQDDPKAAQKILLKVATLAVDAAKRGQMNFHTGSSGNTLKGQVFEFTIRRLGQKMYQQDSQRFGPYLMIFLVDFFSSPEGELVQINYSVTNAIDRVLREMYSKLRKENKKTLPVDQVIQKLYGKLGEVLKNRSSILLTPNLSTLFQQKIRDKKSRQKIKKWAKQEMQDGKYPELASNFYAILCLNEEIKGNRKKSKSSKKRFELSDSLQHFRKLINDTKQPLALRVMIANWIIGREGTDLLPLEVARDIVSLHIASMEKNVPTQRSQEQNFLKVLFSIQEETTAAELLDKWREQFAKRYLRTTPRIVGRQYVQPATLSLNSSSQNDQTLFSQLMTIYLRTDDSKQINMLLKKHDSQTSKSPLAMAQLVRFGKHELAVRLFRKHKTKFGSKWPKNSMGYYSKEIQEQTPKLISEISSPDDQYFAKVLLASMQDPPKKKAEGTDNLPFPNRDERLLKLAEQIKEVKFTGTGYKVKTILIMLSSSKTKPFLTKALESDYKNLEIPDSIGDNERRLKEIRSLLICYTRLRMQQGDIGPLIETLENLSKPRPKYDYVFKHLGVGVLYDSGFKMLQAGEIRLPAKQSKAVAKTLRAMAKHKKQSKKDHVYNSMLLVSHIWSGQTDLFLEWYQNLPEKLRKELSQSSFSSRIWELEGSGLTVCDKNLPRRIDFVHNVLRAAVKNKWYIWSPTRRNKLYYDNSPSFQRLRKSGLMTTKEIIAHCPAIVEKIDDKGLLKATLADWLHEKRKYKEAVAAWQSAIAVADKDQPQVHYWHGALARSLERLKKYDEAKEALSKMNVEKISSSRYRSQMKSLQSTINRAAAKSSTKKTSAITNTFESEIQVTLPARALTQPPLPPLPMLAPTPVP